MQTPFADVARGHLFLPSSPLQKLHQYPQVRLVYPDLSCELKGLLKLAWDDKKPKQTPFQIQRTCSHTQRGLTLALNIKTTKENWPQRANSHVDQDLNIFISPKITRKLAYPRGELMEIEGKRIIFRHHFKIFLICAEKKTKQLY